MSQGEIGWQVLSWRRSFQQGAVEVVHGRAWRVEGDVKLLVFQ